MGRMVMGEHSVSMYAAAKDAEIATLRAEIEQLRELAVSGINDGFDMCKADYKEQFAEYEAEIERLRHVCSWAAGRLLDAGDVYEYEKMLELRGESGNA